MSGRLHLAFRPLFNRLKGRPSPITPQEYLRRDSPRARQVVVMLGDSLTEGILSANFVDPLQERLGPRGFDFINAGVSADLAYSLLMRVEEVIACRPDRVVILVGANDCQGSNSPGMAKMLMRMKNLPRLPDEDWFCENLRALTIRLGAALPECRLALMSLGVFGEALDSPANRDMARFSQHICEIALETGADYLPLHERFIAALTGMRGRRALAFGDRRVLSMIYQAGVIQRRLLGQSFDRIGAANGFHLLSDGLHFNDRGACIVEQLVEGWLTTDGA